MCGIAGLVSAQAYDAEAMVSALRHRGPDARGMFREEIAGRQVCLGHTRLSIIDLSSAGNQPMFAADGKVAMVYNGEVYNFRELRDQYLRGAELRSHTDTEVVLRLYERFGLDCLRHLNGDFALAILDLRVGRLYLVRDRAGVKPLYYRVESGSLLFASEIKAILAAGSRAELASEHLQKYFVFKYVPGNDTLFRGIRRVPPAHVLEVDILRGTHTLRRYWDYPRGTVSPLRYSEARQQLHELVADATRLRLVSDVPVGTFLSGGLDSSIIATLLSSNDQITHYCAVQDEADTRVEGTTSDAYYARRLSRELGLRLVPVSIGAGNLTPDQIETTVRFGDDLIADAAQIPSYLITRGAAKTSKVFLSGMGADELFLGYPGHRLTLLSRYMDRMALPAVAWQALSGMDQGRGRFKSFRRYLYRLGRYRSYPSYRYGIYSLVGDFEGSLAVCRGDPDEVRQFLAGYFPPDSDPFESLSRFEYENFLQKNLAYVDRMSMANSVEVRVPFLDHRLMEFAYPLPHRYKLTAAGGTKRILADSFADQVPRYIIRRRKAGFGMPIRATFASRFAVERLLDLRYLAETAPFDLPHINALIDRHVAGHEDNSAIIYALISFQEWHRIYIRNAR